MAQGRVNFNPGISSVRAIVTTRWQDRGYKPKVIHKIESYTVDTALDTDADSWHVEIGDPYGSLVDCLRRDSEVRVQLFGVGNSPNYIMTGLADNVDFSDEGVMTFSSRDLSSLAMDSTVPPSKFKHVRPWAIVANQARELGMQRTDLSKGAMVKKVIHTDGSESYWEFWYRLYRTEKMWIWTEPNGTLRADLLNYTSHPTYYLGEPKDDDTRRVKSMHIPVEQMSVRKSTQARVHEVWVFYHKGKYGAHEIQFDPTMRNWQKRPRKVVLDANAHTPKAARKAAWEEIFEGKVGELEYTVTIPDPGFLLRQNAIARLRIPQLNIIGDFFVVGIQAQAGPNGAMQQIRLRDRKLALTRRIPSEPKALSGGGPKSLKVSTAEGDALGSEAGVPENWGNYFVNAARKFCGPWDYSLFLACLLGIADQETGFRNVRQNGGPGGDGIVYPDGGKPTKGLFTGSGLAEAINLWKAEFANEKGDGYVGMDYGVGPMQLTDLGVKHFADDFVKSGFHDEWEGGRWNPEANIWAAGWYLRECLKGRTDDSGKDEEIWGGVDAYNRGVAGARDYWNQHGTVSPYAKSVRNKVETDPGYLADIASARDQGVQSAQQPGSYSPNTVDQPPAPAPGKENSKAALGSLTHLQGASTSVNLKNVNWRLLTAVNNLGVAIGHKMIVSDNGGFRSHQDQIDAWEHSDHGRKFPAANPYTSTSNHEIGEALDVVIDTPGGPAIGDFVPAQTLEKYGIHNSVRDSSGKTIDMVHVTLLGVWG